jgi:hypothetical protein
MGGRVVEEWQNISPFKGTFWGIKGFSGGFGVFTLHPFLSWWGWWG